MKYLISLSIAVLLFTGCDLYKTESSAESKAVEAQQAQYLKTQPVPAYDWSLERDLLIKLYNLRNDKVSTHSVWRSQMGTIEGDCTSMGYGLPYDTSLTNPLISVDRAGNRKVGDVTDYSLTSVSQPEPNGIFASTNTSATWVLCVNKSGAIEPVYTEAALNVYPYQVTVNYKTNRVIRKSGSKAVILK
jgi:hypothetical protein